MRAVGLRPGQVRPERRTSSNEGGGPQAWTGEAREACLIKWGLWASGLDRWGQRGVPHQMRAVGLRPGQVRQERRTSSNEGGGPQAWTGEAREAYLIKWGRWASGLDRWGKRGVPHQMRVVGLRPGQVRQERRTSSNEGGGPQVWTGEAREAYLIKWGRWASGLDRWGKRGVPHQMRAVGLRPGQVRQEKRTSSNEGGGRQAWTGEAREAYLIKWGRSASGLDRWGPRGVPHQMRAVGLRPGQVRPERRTSSNEGGGPEAWTGEAREAYLIKWGRWASGLDRWGARGVPHLMRAVGLRPGQVRPERRASSYEGGGPQAWTGEAREACLIKWGRWASGLDRWGARGVPHQMRAVSLRPGTGEAREAYLIKWGRWAWGLDRWGPRGVPHQMRAVGLRPGQVRRERRTSSYEGGGPHAWTGEAREACLILWGRWASGLDRWGQRGVPHQMRTVGLRPGQVRPERRTSSNEGGGPQAWTGEAREAYLIKWGRSASGLDRWGQRGVPHQMRAVDLRPGQVRPERRASSYEGGGPQAWTGEAREAYLIKWGRWASGLDRWGQRGVPHQMRAVGLRPGQVRPERRASSNEGGGPQAWTGEAREACLIKWGRWASGLDRWGQRGVPHQMRAVGKKVTQSDWPAIRSLESRHTEQLLKAFVTRDTQSHDTLTTHRKCAIWHTKLGRRRAQKQWVEQTCMVSTF